MYNLFTQKHTECKEKITALLALITIKASKHLNSFKINIMEKSKAFELIEFVWNNEKTDSYLRVNIAMYEAVKLAIISQMKFNKEDFHIYFQNSAVVTGLESTPMVRAMVRTSIGKLLLREIFQPAKAMKHSATLNPL